MRHQKRVEVLEREGSFRTDDFEGFTIASGPANALEYYHPELVDGNVPCMCNHDIVEGLMATPKARKPYFKDHEQASEGALMCISCAM